MEKRRRKDLRLQAYDYRQNGAYYVTICTQNRRCLFDIVSGYGVGAAPRGRPDTPAGFAEAWLWTLEEKYPDITLDAYAIMPNHIHVLLLRYGDKGDHMGSPLPKMIGWFKSMTTNAYIRGVRAGQFAPFDGRLWQRGYYEHVVRCEEDLLDIRRYIEENPLKWREDPEYAE